LKKNFQTGIGGLDLKLNIGSKVLYKSQIFMIYYDYGNGYFEIKHEKYGFNKVLLVKLSDFTPLE
jgi:hypothetical protein